MMRKVALWRWLVGTYVIVMIWLFGASGIDWLTATVIDALDVQRSTWLELATALATFIPFAIITPAVWVSFIGQPARGIINFRGRVNYGRIGLGFIVWLALSAAGTAVDYFFLARDAYAWTFDLQKLLPTIIVLVLFLPVQTTAEEMFFRGWVLRWTERRGMWFRVIISGVIFALPHLGNPEAAGQELIALSAWFILGAGWAYTSVRDGSIEAAIGAHLANNAYALLLVGYADSALPSDSVVSTDNINMVGTAIALAITMPLFVLLTRRR